MRASRESLDRVEGESAGPSQLIFVVAEFGEGHFSAELHHLPEYLLRVLLFDQTLVDVADVGEEVTHGCDSVSTVRRDVVIVG